MSDRNDSYVPGWCLRRIRSWGAPAGWDFSAWMDEAKQIAVEAAWEAQKDLDPNGNVPLRRFVAGRVLNRVRTRFRQECKQGAHCDLTPDLMVDISGSRLQHDDLIEALREAVDTLPEAHRAVIRDYYYQGRNESQIAESLGISQQAVSKRKARAMELLKASIEQE